MVQLLSGKKKQFHNYVKLFMYVAYIAAGGLEFKHIWKSLLFLAVNSMKVANYEQFHCVTAL